MRRWVLVAQCVSKAAFCYDSMNVVRSWVTWSGWRFVVILNKSGRWAIRVAGVPTTDSVNGRDFGVISSRVTVLSLGSASLKRVIAICLWRGLESRFRAVGSHIAIQFSGWALELQLRLRVLFSGLDFASIRGSVF